MPLTQVNGCHIHYEIAGSANAPVLVLSNSLGTNFSMWDAQMAELRKNFRVLRYDTRGHGKSEVTPGPYSFEQLGRDVLALADALDIGHFSLCGLSIAFSACVLSSLHPFLIARSFFRRGFNPRR